MKRLTVFLTALMLPFMAHAEVNPLLVQVDAIGSDGAIGEHYALCKATSDGKSQPSDNIRPTIRWSGAPMSVQAGVRSYAVIVMDPDVPADFTDAGKVGKTISKEAPRQDFYHWALINIPITTVQLNSGDAKTPPPVGEQLLTSLGKYVSDPRQYGGPCPPWNDQVMHHYHFIVLALNVERLDMQATATGGDVLSAANGHVVARGEAVGTYTLNPVLRSSKQ